MNPSASEQIGYGLALPISVAVIVPTYNERGNVGELISRLRTHLQGYAWEVLFVDDDSPDSTADLLAVYARRDPHIRVLRRIGRRGLSSACIEGVLATTAPLIAIMDADLQHDESILPKLFAELHTGGYDLAVGSRNADGGGMGEFRRSRVMLSRMGKKVSNAVCRCTVSDPMSGFFAFRREVFLEVVHRLHGGGFKILVDMLASLERPVRFCEVGYTFRNRVHGESKLDVNTGVEYLFLVIDKLTRRAIPSRLAAFLFVGSIGLAAHVAVLSLLLFALKRPFLQAQVTATFVAMTVNFFLNNLITWRDRSLRGARIVLGLLTFYAACSFGAWANLVIARVLLHSGKPWLTAGTAGILLSTVWNYSMSNLFTWGKKRNVRVSAVSHVVTAAMVE